MIRAVLIYRFLAYKLCTYVYKLSKFLFNFILKLQVYLKMSTAEAAAVPALGLIGNLAQSFGVNEAALRLLLSIFGGK